MVVVTEYAEGELFQILEDDGSLPESQVDYIFSTIIFLDQLEITTLRIKRNHICPKKALLAVAQAAFNLSF